ncbi:MAG: c-type cytochrome [Bacteroidota bacterium]|nr:c-type cytochrome [Bacteroidota bacterium]
MKLTSLVYISFVSLILMFACKEDHSNTVKIKQDSISKKTSIDSIEAIWQVPDTSTIPQNEFGDAVRYGRDLIVNTAYYIGPEGKVSKNLGNKMNCTNCHLEAGTKPYAFNYFSTHARYPQYRAREDKILSLAERVNNCIERPHNGKPLKLESKEMTAIICYIKWLGQNVPVDKHVKGDKPIEITFLDRPADPVKGEEIYMRECKTCHGVDGEGKMRADNVCYEFPPLWGLKSYQPGSSMHRVVKAAAFIYANMPNATTSYDKPKLTMEEAFDVAAFVNDDRIHKRPVNNGISNYPNFKHKPIDYGKGPYIDSFPEIQHKFGPYQPIIDYRKSKGLEIKF